MDRVRIYQLLPRLFGNTNETRKASGTLMENGVGKFADITEAALVSLRDDLHITHVWLTGILSQATATDYSAIGKPPDHPGLLKGLAGSPYAIRDYGDVSPDYAVHPESRLAEFEALTARIQGCGLKVIIDFVANHVARSYASTTFAFGTNDDRTRFFAPGNDFFWLQPDSPGGGPPLRLPGTDEEFSDGVHEGEIGVGRVTGNNSATWRPSIHDWYETVKLNFGYDFTTGARAFPHPGNPHAATPETWIKMDAVLAFWQSRGADGFRCDMAHMVPPEFWNWAIVRARQRSSGVFFTAEAYENDPMKVDPVDDTLKCGGTLDALLRAGFDSIYDDPAYKLVKRIYDGPAWANDLDSTLLARDTGFFSAALRYGENHDEVRLAGGGEWASIGMDVGRAVCGVLFGISRGPTLLLCGQEVGEPAEGTEGFGKNDARTTIFDYWCMPEFAKWVNGHRYDGGRLSPEQQSLRAFYGRLNAACAAPAFREGAFVPLNGANTENPDFGRLEGEPASGHWLYAYLRIPKSNPPFLVVVNLHRHMTFQNVRVLLSEEARELFPLGGLTLVFSDCVGETGTHRMTAETAIASGFLVPKLPPLTPAYLKISFES